MIRRIYGTLSFLILVGLLLKPAVYSLEKECSKSAQPGISPASEELVPESGVEIMTHRKWQSSGWAGEINAKSFSLNLETDCPRFTVGDPKLRHVWVYYLALPIDFNLYPIVVLKYSASNTAANLSYVIWVDDGTGPNDGGKDLFTINELIPDGKVHVLKKDLREFHPKGSISCIALGVMCGDAAPAVFDLAGLSFETPPDTSLKESLKEDVPLNFLVVNSEEEPVNGAKVAVDAERSNFARIAFTDKDGLCSITPLKNESGKHMVRVEVEGMVPVECLDVKQIGGDPLKVYVFRKKDKAALI